MKQENLSQRVLMEVLTQEIETLKAASKTINQVAPAVEQKLNEVKNMRLTASVNRDQINEMEAIFKRYLPELDKKVARSVTLPNWLIISLFVAFISLTVSVGINFHQKNKFKEMETSARYWYDTAVDYGYKPQEK